MESCNKEENLKQFIHLHNVINSIYKFLIDPLNTIMKILNINHD